MISYQRMATLFKIMSNVTRLQILELLSCGSLCACKILDYLEISQPTLSHHMKILTEYGFVQGKKEGTWMHYTLNEEMTGYLHAVIDNLMTDTEECICNEVSLDNMDQQN